MYAQTYRRFLQGKSRTETKGAGICNSTCALGETEVKRGSMGRGGEGRETLGNARRYQKEQRREETSDSNRPHHFVQ